MVIDKGFQKGPNNGDNDNDKWQWQMTNDSDSDNDKNGKMATIETMEFLLMYN